VADEPEQQQPEASQEELLARLEEELGKLKVADVLVQTVFTVSSLGYRSLGEDHRDLDQARLAIDALRALVTVLKDTVSDDVARDFDQVIANMQLAYAKATRNEPPPDE
jgi:uncharacterized protein DUF1844